MDISDRLLDAHVDHVLRQLTGERFASLVETEIDYLLARAAEMIVEDVIDREDVKAVAVKYASGFTLPGAIPEIVGDIAARVRLHPANDAPLGEVLARRHVEAAAAKVAELRPLRERLVTGLAQSPAVQTWLAQYLLSLATGPIAYNRRLAERVPGVGRMLSAGERLADGVLREADQRSHELAERAAAGMLQQWTANIAASVDDEELAEALVDAWDRVATRPVRELLDATEDDDVIDLIVIGYEAWLELRSTPYLTSLIATGVDFFFDTYGSFTLTELLAEFGLARADLVEEAMRFAPRALEALTESGDLESFVRRQLSGFYESDEARAVLGTAT